MENNAFIKNNIQTVLQKIESAAKKIGKASKDIKIIAVTKTVHPDQMMKAFDAGLFEFGENRVQELSKKYHEMSKNINWHMIGHLQSNKVKSVIDKVCMIHSLENFSLAKEIQNKAKDIEKIIDILVQVNISGEISKHGATYDDTLPLIEKISTLENIRTKGLMTVAPYTENPENTRWVFAKLKELSDKIKNRNLKNVEMQYLSMGMSNDFEIAIQEGSNMVRIGSMIFGDREY